MEGLERVLLRQGTGCVAPRMGTGAGKEGESCASLGCGSAALGWLSRAPPCRSRRVTSPCPCPANTHPSALDGSPAPAQPAPPPGCRSVLQKLLQGGMLEADPEAMAEWEAIQRQFDPPDNFRMKVGAGMFLPLRPLAGQRRCLSHATPRHTAPRTAFSPRLSQGLL